MNLRHDIIKMRYVDEGYLPNYPYHLISDSEMCDAFLKLYRDDRNRLSIKKSTGFFFDYYPCIEGFEEEYSALVIAIYYHLELLKRSEKVVIKSSYGATIGYEDTYVLPDWVYSYMMGNVIGPNSEIIDIHDMLVLMNLDNIDDIFTKEAAACALKLSTKWTKKLEAKNKVHRPPTFFGEPHVLKALRLMDINNTEILENK